MRRVLSTIVVGVAISPGTLGSADAAATSPAKPSVVLSTMKEELARAIAGFQKQPAPPYFLGYEITELESVEVYASFGTLVASTQRRRRALDIDLRVGDYSLDNSHPVRGSFSFGLADRQGFDVPIDDDAAAIRQVLWFQTEQRYKRALEQLTKVKTNVQVKVEEEDKAGDFSKAPAETAIEPIVPLRVDRKAWEERLRAITRPFARHADIYDSDATFTATRETRWYVNSEGAALQTSQPVYRLLISGMTKADDGMELPRFETFASLTPTGLPDEATLLKAVERIITDLHALQKAPLVEAYTGPALLSGRASSVFFHEIFGHRIEGHRLKRVEDAQTFKKKLNEAVLPESFSVYFDPTVSHVGTTDLVGHYRFDNEGVKARRVTAVEKGVLKSFLMSRSPVEGFPTSNGHGRRAVGLAPVARQSNLLVQVEAPLTHAALKQKLLDEMKASGKPFGLIFDDIKGGFTTTGRVLPNAFNVMPVMVYKVHPDGREELVRGVDLIGTPLSMFSRIVAADDQIEVFNGICGAESGGVPVAAAAPGVFVSQVEVQKKEVSQERPPLLPAPEGIGLPVLASEGGRR